MVAVRNRRDYIGIELNPEYAQMGRDRIADGERLGWRTPTRDVEPIPGQVSLLEQPSMNGHLDSGELEAVSNL